MIRRALAAWLARHVADGPADVSPLDRLDGLRLPPEPDPDAEPIYAQMVAERATAMRQTLADQLPLLEDLAALRLGAHQTHTDPDVPCSCTEPLDLLLGGHQ